MAEPGEGAPRLVINSRGDERSYGLPARPVVEPEPGPKAAQPGQISEEEKAKLIGKSVAEAMQASRIGVNRKEPIIDVHQLAQETARAQGLLSPEQYLEDYRDAEEFLKAPFQIVPGAEPRFWPLLSEKEKQEWMIRSTLVIAAYKKSVATGTDKLYMDEMRELAVDLNKRALKILFGSRNKEGALERPEYEGVDGVLPATSIYCTIIGDRRFYGMGSDNVFYYDSDNKPTKSNLKEVFCSELSEEEKWKLTEDYGEDAVLRGYQDTSGREHKGLFELAKDLRNSCPDSIYIHDEKDDEGKDWGTNISQESFRKLRESVRFWLTTRGRDLLLTVEERNRREDFYNNGISWENGRPKQPSDTKDLGIDVNSPEWKNLSKEDRDSLRKHMTKLYVYRVLQDRARDAEQIAWNFVYSTSVLEHFDSRDYRPLGTKRHNPSNFWALFQWTPMHLQERLEQKIVRSDDPDKREAKEEWSAVGPWALHTFSARLWKKEVVMHWQRTKELDSKSKPILDKDGKETTKLEYVPKMYLVKKLDNKGKPILDANGKEIKVSVPAIKERLSEQILPDTVFRDALHPSVFQTVTRRLENGKIEYKEGDEGKGFFPIFNEIGNKVLFDPENTTRVEIETKIDWGRVKDSPFVPFIFDEMRWADVVQQVFKKGMGSRIGLADLGEAVRNLRLPRDMREKLIMIYYGLDPNSSKMKTKESRIDWTLRMAAFNEFNPNFFLEK